jgi:thiamine transporter
MSKRNTTRMLVEGGLMIALATVLSIIVIYTMPQGGSITPASMVPLILFAFKWGVGPGLLAGLGYGAIQAILPGAYVLHPVQFLLDYPLAFACLGLAGLFRSKPWGVYPGAVLGILMRFVCHLLSGVVFFASYAGEQNVWIYSALYNGSFLGVELAISLAVLVVLYVALPKKYLYLE